MDQKPVTNRLGIILLDILGILVCIAWIIAIGYWIYRVVTQTGEFDSAGLEPQQQGNYQQKVFVYSLLGVVLAIPAVKAIFRKIKALRTKRPAA